MLEQLSIHSRRDVTPGIRINVYSALHKHGASVDASRRLCYIALQHIRPIGKRNRTTASGVAGLRTEMPLKLSRHARQLRPVSL